MAEMVFKIIGIVVVLVLAVSFFTDADKMMDNTLEHSIDTSKNMYSTVKEQIDNWKEDGTESQNTTEP